MREGKGGGAAIKVIMIDTRKSTHKVCRGAVGKPGRAEGEWRRREEEEGGKGRGRRERGKEKDGGEERKGKDKKVSGKEGESGMG